jgi:hypothetical protein
VAEMSRKSRQKSGHDRHYPKDRYSPGKCDYMERQKKMKAEVMKKYDCHVHTRRIYRYGLRPNLLITVSCTHHTSHRPVSRDEAVGILRMYQEEFREMGRIKFEMRDEP